MASLLHRLGEKKEACYNLHAHVRNTYLTKSSALKARVKRTLENTDKGLSWYYLDS